MTILEIEKNIQNLLKNFNKDEFVFDFLLSFGLPKATIARLKKGELNKLKTAGEIHLRAKFFFKVGSKDTLHQSIDKLQKEFLPKKKAPRFLVVTDYETLLAIDTKTKETLDIELKELTKHYDFFLPLAGIEKTQVIDENPADVKASLKMAKLYDEIVGENELKTPEDNHALNIFLIRLLFCYFAEDSGIFKENQFTNAISNYTQTDGNDMHEFLQRVFEVLDTQNKDESLPKYLKEFPYVNGKLFAKRYPIPKFNKKARDILLELGGLDWSVINPDIFGSMIQSVVTPEHRGSLGMHYTSVPNILKVIKPLFLDELYEEFIEAKGNSKRLNKLHKRISELKIFDPACGSGNFLIISYKELRRLEMLIFKEGGLLISPSIKLSQFYGIEIDDFASEVAKLSLWLAEHQMNMLFKKEFGVVPPPLPLKDSGNILHANATRVEWEEVCPKNEDDEIYVLGNPPYLGSRNQNDEQKDDMKHIFKTKYKSLDYISCWFYLASEYIRGFNAKFAFVSTNSISQGEQVALLWPRVLKDDLEICFAHQSFKWTNNAKGNAGVTVVVIGVTNKGKCKKHIIFKNDLQQEVKKINPYLVIGSNIYIKKRPKTFSNLPLMQYGNMPLEGTYLRFNEIQKNEITKNNNNRIEKFIRKVIGGEELLKGINRYCFWIEDDELNEALEFDEIRLRVEKVKKFREHGGEVAKTLVNRSHQFRYRHVANNNQIIIPCTSSENREYLPISIESSTIITLNSVQVIMDPEPWIFAVITSKMHMVWMRAVAGRLKTDYRYSSSLVYNTFPFPNITQKQKDILTEHAFAIIDEREKHSEKTLAQLYDPNKMPQGLKQAHHQLDLAVERCYRKKPFESDEERLEYLFELYEKMVREE